MRHPAWAICIVAMAFFMKAAIPTGYMPVLAGGSIAIELCSGWGPETMTMAMPGMADRHEKHGRGSKDDVPCGFAGHAPASMASVDPVLLVTAIAYIVATIVRPADAGSAQPLRFLRPHLRGPPATG